MKITKSGIYDLSDEAYHEDPCPEPSLSRSIAVKLLVQSPAHARDAHPRLNPDYEEKHKKEFDIGTAAHDLLLRGEDNMVVLPFDSFRKKDAKEARDEAYAAGKTPLLEKDADAVRAMADAAGQQLGTHEIGNVLHECEAEKTIVWQEHGVWCRAKADLLSKHILLGTASIPHLPLLDYKSTGGSAHPDVWGKYLYQAGLDIQDAFYSRGLQAVLGLERLPQMAFIVQETAPPYALCVHAVPPMGRDAAMQEVERAIRLWRECLTCGRWPGYPNRVCYTDPPPWKLTSRMEQHEIDRTNKQAGKSLIETAIDWQAPL